MERDEAQQYSLCTSEETLAELGQGEYPRQRQVIRFAAKVPLLEPHAAIPGIAQVYVEHRLMPQSLKGDALHLAYASFYKTDFLLTWNCDHLANANKRRHLRWLNTRLNLCIPEIVTPLELVTESSDEN